MIALMSVRPQNSIFVQENLVLGAGRWHWLSIISQRPTVFWKHTLAAVCRRNSILNILEPLHIFIQSRPLHSLCCKYLLSVNLSAHPSETRSDFRKPCLISTNDFTSSPCIFNNLVWEAWHCTIFASMLSLILVFEKSVVQRLYVQDTIFMFAKNGEALQYYE